MELTDYTFEELAHAIYLKGESSGISKITDKTKWREAVAAEKLGHTVFPKISAGNDPNKKGADAHDANRKKHEYKSVALNDDQLKNLFEEQYGRNRYKPLTVQGVYNGAYTDEAIDSYNDIGHWITIFHKEICVLCIKVNTDEVIKQLTKGHRDRRLGATTNCNTVSINLKDKNLYEVGYKNEHWFNEMKKQRNKDVIASNILFEYV